MREQPARLNPRTRPQRMRAVFSQQLSKALKWHMPRENSPVVSRDIAAERRQGT